MKQVYQLRKTDFIPIIGLKNHVDRCLKELDKRPILCLSEYYSAECLEGIFY